MLVTNKKIWGIGWEEPEAELRQMLDLTPQYLCVLGADGRPLYANRASLDYPCASEIEIEDRVLADSESPQ